MKKLALLIFAIVIMAGLFPQSAYALSGEWVFDYAVTSCVEEGTYPDDTYNYSDNYFHCVEDIGRVGLIIYEYEVRWDDPPKTIMLGHEDKVSFAASSKVLQNPTIGNVRVEAEMQVSHWQDAVGNIPAGYFGIMQTKKLDTEALWSDKSDDTGKEMMIQLLPVDVEDMERYDSTLGLEPDYELKIELSINSKYRRAYYYTLAVDTTGFGEAPGAITEVTTEADEESGESGLLIPGIVTAAILIGGGAIGKKAKGGKKKDPKTENSQRRQEEQEEDKSSYEMRIRKDFGNTLYPGEQVTIYARIVEITPEGVEKPRPELTAKISISSPAYLKISGQSMAGEYIGAFVTAPNDSAEIPEKAILSFRFAGGVGSFTNNVVFQIAPEAEIIFADEGLTFVACEAQRFSMPFIVKGMGDLPDISAETDDESCFRVSVSPGENGLWNAEVTECGTKQLIPGTMEEYKCTVTATSGGRSVKGSFIAFRYHEGLRLRIGALKCYPVVMTDIEKEILSEDPKVKQTPAHTRVELTLYTWDKETGKLRNPIPESCPEFNFEDVPGSDVLADLKGDKVEKPCETLKFVYSVKDVAFNDNTVIGEIYPTGGVLIPPNRSRAVVTAKVQWGVREFTAKQEVTLTSQPYRERGDNASAFALIEQDAKYRENLYRIQRKIMWEDKYSELRPMAHKIELMLRGYSDEYGFYMPDYEKIVSLFDRYTTGELGSVEANEKALSWKSIIADGVLMTLSDFAESGKGIAGRIAIGIMTSGASEFVFLPAHALNEMKKYVDQGGDSALEGFEVGLRVAVQDKLNEVSIKWGFKLGKATLSAGAKLLRKGAEAAKQAMNKCSKQLAKCFASADYADDLVKATQKTSKQLKSAKKAASEKIIKYRRFVEESTELIAEDAAFGVGRTQGLRKLQKLEEAIKGNYPKEKLRKAVLEVQMDKHAMHQLKESTQLGADGLCARFNKEMAQLNDEAIMNTRKQLAKQYKVPIDDIQLAQASGNSDELARLGKSVGMDKDLTFRIKTDSGFVDISERIAAEAYNAEFYRAAHCGSVIFDRKLAREFAQMCDQSIVSMVGKESYGTWEDLLRVLEKSRAGERFDDVAKVASTVTYKSEHWLKLAEESRKSAQKAMANGNDEVAGFALSVAEAMTEEGLRQSTKQFDRIIIPRLELLAARGKAPNMRALMEKMEMLKKIGLGTHGPTGITVAEGRAVLGKAYSSTFESVIAEVEQAVYLTDSLL